MTKNLLVKLFEHNNWANQEILQVCGNLSEGQLDAEPQSATLGSIRQTLIHLAAAQHGYLSLLTLPVDSRKEVDLEFSDLAESMRSSGDALLELARKAENHSLQIKLTTKKGYLVEPWVVFVQIINHATEHREQINSMLSSMKLSHPDLDAWAYGETTNALIPPNT